MLPYPMTTPTIETIDKKQNAIAAIVTSNYIPQALTLYSYIKESNPEQDYIVLVIGEKQDAVGPLPTGPQWIYWEALVDQERRIALAMEFTPFELSCIMRGRFHQYLTTSGYKSWMMVDPDIGIYASLEPIWQQLSSSCIALTPHSNKPVRIDQALPHERNLLKYGLFNAGVVAMRRTECSQEASQWLLERLEQFGHCYPDRQATGLANCNDFEFADQIWLNLLFLYFSADIAILDGEVCNLGHWNLHQGSLSINEGKPYFNGKRVIMAHFSSLPSRDKLSHVSIHTQLYAESPSSTWATLATDYLDRLDRAKASYPADPYHYAHIQPGSNAASKLTSPSHNHCENAGTRFLNKTANRLTSLGRPGKLRNYLKYMLWRLGERL